MIPTYIAAYEILGKLGEGAYGQVYLAYHPFLERQVAIKTLHTDLSSDPDLVSQFMSEARAIARLRHNNIVSVYEFATLHDRPIPLTYMVMEYLPGESLEQRIKAGALTLEESIGILDQLASALDYAHERGVIHRDLKPANILFSEQGQPVIVDFGLAKLLELGRNLPANADPMTTRLTGTPMYMAPEQALSLGTCAQTDQYTLALIAYQLVTGRLPFDESNPMRLMTARLHEAPTLSAISPAYKAADVALLQALSIEPDDRYPTTGEFVTALERALLPDRKPQTIIDPEQAARLAAAEQTLKGFLGAMALAVGLVILFCVSLFARHYRGGLENFLWDGIIGGQQVESGFVNVVGLWPGSVAERAGVEIGDIVPTHRESYFIRESINSEHLRTAPPGTIFRTQTELAFYLYRGDDRLLVRFAPEPSPIYLWGLAASLIAALGAFVAAVWLLFTRGVERGVRFLVPMLLLASLTVVAANVNYILSWLDTMLTYLLLSASIHFALSFPETVPTFIRAPRRAVLLYLPVLVGLLQFVSGQRLMIFTLEVSNIVYVLYGTLMISVILLKWGREQRRYPALRWLMLGYTVLLVALIGQALLFELDNIDVTFMSFWVRLVNAGGLLLLVVFSAYGYARLHPRSAPPNLMPPVPPLIPLLWRADERPTDVRATGSGRAVNVTAQSR